MLDAVVKRTFLPLLAGCQAKPQGDVGLAGAARSECDHIVPSVDEFAAGEFHGQRLVQRGHHLEVEAVEALGGRELSRFDASFDHPPLAFDQLELAKPQQIVSMVLALGGTLLWRAWHVRSVNVGRRSCLR